MTSHQTNTKPEKPSLDQRTSFLIGTAIVLPIAIAGADIFADEIKAWLGFGQPSMSLYQNESLRFRYPEDWQIQEQVSPQGRKQQVTLMAPVESGNFDESPVVLTLTMTQLVAGDQSTAEQFYTSQKQQIEGLHNISLPSSPPLKVNLGGYLGQGVKYKVQSEGETWEHLLSWVEVANTRYELDYRSLTTITPTTETSTLAEIHTSLQFTP